MTDKTMTNEMNDLKKLSEIISEARTSFNEILTGVCDDLTRKLGSIYITFDTITVDEAYQKYCTDINGYGRTTAFGNGFFCDDPNNQININNLDPTSLVEELDTIIETAKPYKRED